jgi:hypothetical protein
MSRACTEATCSFMHGVMYAKDCNGDGPGDHVDVVGRMFRR